MAVEKLSRLLIGRNCKRVVLFIYWARRSLTSLIIGRLNNRTNFKLECRTAGCERKHVSPFADIGSRPLSARGLHLKQHARIKRRSTHDVTCNDSWLLILCCVFERKMAETISSARRGFLDFSPVRRDEGNKENDIPTLSLVQFSKAPFLTFGTVKLGTSKSAVLQIENPTEDVEAVVNVAKIPSSKGFSVDCSTFTIQVCFPT